MPSFRPLGLCSAEVPLEEPRPDIHVTARADQRAIVRAPAGVPALGNYTAPTPREGRLARMPRSVRPRRGILLVCCVFLSGVAAGLGGARLADSGIRLESAEAAILAMPEAVATTVSAVLHEKIIFRRDALSFSQAAAERPTLREATALPDPLLARTDQSWVPVPRDQRSLAEPRPPTAASNQAVDDIQQDRAIVPGDVGSLADDQHAQRSVPVTVNAATNSSPDESNPLGAVSIGDLDARATGPVATPPEAGARDTAGDHAGSEGPLASDKAFVALGLKRGDEAMASGDIVAARRFYELAANYGSALAATAVGRTYDPAYLANLRVLGLQPDAVKARYWYEKAERQGDAEARVRLNGFLGTIEGINQRGR